MQVKILSHRSHSLIIRRHEDNNEILICKSTMLTETMRQKKRAMMCICELFNCLNSSINTISTEKLLIESIDAKVK